MALNFGDDEDEYVAPDPREARPGSIPWAVTLPVEATEDHLRAADEGRVKD